MLHFNILTCQAHRLNLVDDGLLMSIQIAGYDDFQIKWILLLFYHVEHFVLNLQDATEV